MYQRKGKINFNNKEEIILKQIGKEAMNYVIMSDKTVSKQN